MIPLRFAHSVSKILLAVGVTTVVLGFVTACGEDGKNAQPCPILPLYDARKRANLSAAAKATLLEAEKAGCLTPLGDAGSLTDGGRG